MNSHDATRATPFEAPHRIAIVASFAPSLLRFRGDLIAAICANGHKVLCLAPDFDGETRQALAGLGATSQDYPLARRGMNPWADLRSITALTGHFRRWRPDIVTGYTPKAALYSAIAAARAHTPRIVPMITGLGYAFLGDPGRKVQILRWISKALYRRALANSHAAIFHNEDDARLLRQLGVMPRTLPVHLVGGSGVNRAMFPSQPLPAFDRGLVFLMVARLLKQKGVREFCEAAQAVKARSPHSRFWLAGPPEDGEDCVPADVIASYGTCVDFLGQRTDIAELLAQCHVFVLPSHGEGLPRTVLEAMSVGRPVITTDAPGCRSTIEPGGNGLLVPVGDSPALAQAMEQLLRRPDRIAAMAAQSLRLVAEKYEVGAVNQRTMTALGLA